MTDEKQQEALCRFVGVQPTFAPGSVMPTYPPLTLDLCALAERKLQGVEQIHAYYEVNLKAVVGYGAKSMSFQNLRLIVSATKEQRREALLRTLNLWTDE
jgi:hypothetical protein